MASFNVLMLLVRKGIWTIKTTAATIPKNLLFGTDLTWSNSGKIGWLNKHYKTLWIRNCKQY